MVKFFRNIPRYFKEAYHGLGRNIAMTLSSVSAVTVTLMLIAVFLVLALNIESFTVNVEDDLKIHCKIDNTVDDATIAQMKSQIEKIDDVIEVTFSGKDAELTSLIASYGEEGKLFEVYRGEGNPLKNAFIVRVGTGTSIDVVTQQIQRIDGIESALYGGENIINMVDAFSSIRSGGVVFVLFLSALAIFLISNTIKITIFSRKSEISIMRLIGASNGYIRTPYLLEGMVIGLLGAALPMLGVWLGYDMLYKAMDGIFFSALFPLAPVFPTVYQICGVLGLTGVCVGLLGSYISVSRYLWWKRV